MFGSIYVGLSGLTAYSRGLQQISGNVANLNSQGFKGQTTTFESVLGGDARTGLGTAGGGGGEGVRVAGSRTDFSQGELRQSDRDLDLAIQGGGFLMLMRGSEVAYIRTGSFEVNRDGHVVLSGTDYRLAILDAAGAPTPVSVAAHRTGTPAATTTVSFADNLSSTATSLGIGDVVVYDGNGGRHVWQAQFTKAEGPGDWTVAVTDDKGKAIGTQTLSFAGGAVSPATASLSFTDADAALTVLFEFGAGVSSFSAGSVSTLRVASVDGHGTGALTTVGVNAAGRIEIGYSNEEKKELGAVAVASFRDPAALDQQAGGLFVDRGGGGRELFASGDVRAGAVQSRRLEASNVDLTVEFSDLILVQRGFQASSQIISVTNDMIQQLFGIRGQG